MGALVILQADAKTAGVKAGFLFETGFDQVQSAGARQAQEMLRVTQAFQIVGNHDAERSHRLKLAFQTELPMLLQQNGNADPFLLGHDKTPSTREKKRKRPAGISAGLRLDGEYGFD
jgi:hypothetical protein